MSILQRGSEVTVAWLEEFFSKIYKELNAFVLQDRLRSITTGQYLNIDNNDSKMREINTTSDQYFAANKPMNLGFYNNGIVKEIQDDIQFLLKRSK